MEHFDTIHDSPSHIYYSALPLSPSSSWLHKCYSAELSLKVNVVKGLPAEWGACSRTVLLDCYTITLSYWNNTIAVESGGGDIIILDAITGRQMAVLSEHISWVRSVAFSSDGRSLVSGSEDRTVKLWDMQTGGAIKTFCGHTDWVNSVAISVDCSRIVSGSSDDTICLWDIQTGECLYTIKQQHTVSHVSFSPICPQHIISISNSKVWHWNDNDHNIPPSYDGTHIAFSPNHTQFTLCDGKDVTVQKSDSGAVVAKFSVANGRTQYCCFSPDGKLVAAAADNIAYVWKITSSDPYPIETFIGHTDRIKSLVFSSPSTLVSASHDKSIKFWQISTLSTDQVVTNPESTSLYSPPIISVSLQTRAGIATSSDANGVIKIWNISTGICKTSFKTPSADAQNWFKRDAKLLDGRLIATWCDSVTINIWDIGKGEHLKTLITSGCDDLRISGDGFKIFSLGGGYIEAWSMWMWEFLGRAKVELNGGQYLDSLCIDGSRVWIHSDCSSAQEGWEFGTSGSSPIPFNPSTGRPHLDFIGSASQWTDGPCWIKDTVTGKNIFQLSGRYAKPKDIQWDGQYLVAGYESGEVLILDFHHTYSW